MHSDSRFRVLALACFMAFAAGSDAGSLTRLDSEAKAARAISAADQFNYEVRSLHGWLINDPTVFSEAVFRAMAGTTPVELARKPGGVTLACQRGGTMAVRNTKKSPLVIDVEFQECRPFNSPPSVASGPMRLTLLSNTFDVEAVAGIRAGNRERELLVTSVYQFPSSTLHLTTKSNVVMQGHIERIDAAQADMQPHSSLYELRGFTDVEHRYEYPGQAPSVQASRYAAEKVFMSSTSIFGDDFNYLDEEVTFFWGAITSNYGSLIGPFMTRHDFSGLSSRLVSDYTAWTDSTELDGGVRYRFTRGEVPFCLSGAYHFQTRKPLRHSNLDLQAYDSGEMIINRDVKVSLYSAENVPADLPVPVNGMLVHVDIKKVGSFDYDGASLSEAVGPVMDCAPF